MEVITRNAGNGRDGGRAGDEFPELLGDLCNLCWEGCVADEETGDFLTGEVSNWPWGLKLVPEMLERGERWECIPARAVDASAKTVMRVLVYII